MLLYEHRVATEALCFVVMAFAFQLAVHMFKTTDVLVCGQNIIILILFEKGLLYVQEIDLFIFSCSGIQPGNRPGKHSTSGAEVCDISDW